jgi:hypothetical protein
MLEYEGGSFQDRSSFNRLSMMHHLLQFPYHISRVVKGVIVADAVDWEFMKSFT